MMDKRTHRLFWLFIALGTGVFLYWIQEILFPFIIGGIFAYLLTPLVEKLNKKMNRPLATSLVLIPVIGLFFGVLFLLFPLLERQISNLIHDVPHLTATVQTYILDLLNHYSQYLPTYDWNTIKAEAATYLPSAFRWLVNFFLNIITSGMLIANLLSLVIIVPIVTFYLVRDWEKILIKVNGLIPRKQKKDIDHLFREIDTRLSGFIRGQLTVSSILAIYYTIGLTLLGVKYNILIGILTGFFSFIPYVGILSGFFASLLVTFYQFGDFPHLVGLCSIFLIGQVLEGGFLTPNLVGDRVGLHPLWIIFALLTGGLLLGFAGLILAIPLASIIGVLIRFLIKKYLNSNYYDINKK